MSRLLCPARGCWNAKHPRDVLCVPHRLALPWPVQTELASARVLTKIGGDPRRLRRAVKEAVAAADGITVEPSEFHL